MSWNPGVWCISLFLIRRHRHCHRLGGVPHVCNRYGGGLQLRHQVLGWQWQGSAGHWKHHEDSAEYPVGSWYRFRCAPVHELTAPMQSCGRYGVSLFPMPVVYVLQLVWTNLMTRMIFQNVQSSAVAITGAVWQNLLLAQRHFLCLFAPKSPDIQD